MNDPKPPTIINLDELNYQLTHTPPSEDDDGQKLIDFYWHGDCYEDFKALFAGDKVTLLSINGIPLFMAQALEWSELTEGYFIENNMVKEMEKGTVHVRGLILVTCTETQLAENMDDFHSMMQERLEKGDFTN